MNATISDSEIKGYNIFEWTLELEKWDAFFGQRMFF
jgi:hypothetical protein